MNILDHLDLIHVDGPRSDAEVTDKRIHFVLNSWLRSFYPSWNAGPYPFDLYAVALKQTIYRLFERGAKLMLCVRKVDSNVVVGYCVYEYVEDKVVIHYIYVKDGRSKDNPSVSFRRRGIASWIINDVCYGTAQHYANAVTPDRVTYTFKTPATRYFPFSKIKQNYQPSLARAGMEL